MEECGDVNVGQCAEKRGKAIVEPERKINKIELTLLMLQE